jgi:hypothetical protein
VGAVALVLASGVFVQVIGNAFFWDYYIRLHKDARNSWLGVPNQSGTPFPNFGGGYCGACFEDMHGLQWLPPFSALAGHFWLLRHVPFGHGWVEAEADAPWHRYTSLRIDIARHYAAVRVDWWFLAFAQPAGINRRIGLALLALMVIAVLGAALAVIAELKRGPPGLRNDLPVEPHQHQ